MENVTLGFLVATYNEESEIEDLLLSVGPHVDQIVVSDDGSTDSTVEIALRIGAYTVENDHTASCEETRIRGLSYINTDWVLILDADERIPEEHLSQIKGILPDLERSGFTHVYFDQEEYIDGQNTRTFQKIKLAKKSELHLPEVIHGDISVEGNPVNLGWKVIHRKSKDKQIKRETEYLLAYEQKIKEGKMTREWADKVTSWHYFVKPHG